MKNKYHKFQYEETDQLDSLKRRIRKKINRKSRRKERQRLKYAIQDSRELCS